MGIFDAFKKKPKVPPAPGVPTPMDFSRIPVQDVISMREQGLSNDQIITQLKSQGYSFSQIRDALAQADLKMSVIAPVPTEHFPVKEEVEAPAFPQISPLPTEPAAPMPEAAPSPETFGERSLEDIERVLEEIIEEKWKEVGEKLNEFETWKVNFDSKLGAIETRINDLNTRVGNIEQSISARVEEYGKAISDVNVQMQALERVLGKLVPSLSDSIKELRDVVEETKKSIK
ncbi:MAG: hypothetical protein OH319_00845 [Candidatus Parvarchaeota archaeon]|nr:hypothetical protein [Candidatus Jingweiarchaeum tengchongense]MCW1297875.1 hypothetical protein [Candidatus Jingweiarchaeum tengchongense]MCW1299886.1 hypothetical protein [Candidatus Jingweiarchaeum tengchongense]MCW1305110.1 hypothetical protein [Candidatus Jingweiarchaeum tengchongense]MCW1305172.1 hypothetical protein [Candidatus Jingweiarchaeum tengchongense]